MEKAGNRDLSRTRPHFFKVFIPELSSHHLEICADFKKHLKSKPAGDFTLTDPSDNVWKVDLAMEGNMRFFFDKGWSDFAKAHALQLGEFLVFEYDGNTNFSVFVFDVTGCEKESSFYVENHLCEHAGGSGGVDQEEEEEEEVCWVSSLGTSHHIIKKERGEEKVKKKRKWGAARRAAFELSKKRKRRRREKYGLCSKRRNKVSMSMRRNVTEKETERAHRAALLFQSNRPSCVVIMRKSYVYNGFHMRIPKAFSDAHLGDAERLIILRNINGRRWLVSLFSVQFAKFFGAGWRYFCLDNNMEEDDACVFELVKKNEMVVHIFRVAEEITPVVEH